MPTPKIYAAQGRAAALYPVTPLDGSKRAAQQFVDQVTSSPEWLIISKPGPKGWIPKKVYVKEVCDDEFGGQVNTERGRHGWIATPEIQLGHGEVFTRDVKAIADPWLILHELAHISEFEGFHNKEFIYALLALVKQHLGIDAYRALVDSLKIERARLNYRSLAA